MNQESGIKKIKSFTHLDVWKYGHELVVSIYEITKNFPTEEQFGLTNQIRRASVSITSNIAEGFSRNSYKEKVQFYAMALGSVTEVQNQLLVARDIGYLKQKAFATIVEKTVVVNKLLNGLIKKSKTMIHAS